jgi:hypothetical protein
VASKRFPVAAGATPSIVGGPRGPEAYRAELNAMRSGGASAAASTILDYPNLTLPWSQVAPPRSLSPQTGGPIWRNSLNMLPRDGLMRRRPGVAAFAPGGPFPGLTAGVQNELPVFVYNYVSPLDQVTAGGSVGPCAFTSFSQPTALTVMVTNRQAWIYNQGGGGSWKNVTPTYTVGTVAVTNGSTTVTGTGTNWFNAGITGFNHIFINGAFYQICAVASATSLTLTAPYPGTTLSGLTYQIVRTWDTPAPGNNQIAIQNLIYTCLFNQTLYIAGNFMGGSASGALEPAIVKVANIFSATPTSSYILGRSATNPGMDNLPTLREITGIQCLQDGRVVISGCTDTSEGVIFYSSDLADNVWSVPPGGSTVVVERPGPIYALGKLGNNLTLHYQDGIVLGLPTGLADPPLAFQPTRATVGCYAPRTLRNLGGREIFLSADSNVFGFDGDQTLAIGDEVRPLLAGLGASFVKTNVHAGVNHKWNEYTLYAPYAFGLNDGNTPAYTLQLDAGAWWQLQYPVPIGAAGDAAPTTADYAIIGTYSNDNGAIRPMMQALSSSATSDALAFSLSATVLHRLETDDLDFGAPMAYKTADAVVVFLRGFPSAGTATIQCQVSRDGGGTWTSSVVKTIAVGATGEVPIQFSFRDAIGAGLLLRYRLLLGASGALNFAPTRLLIEADVGVDAGTVQL